MWAAQEVFHARIEEEAQVDVARVRQHHDERHQRTAGATDLDVTEVPPIHLPLFRRQRAEPQERLGWLAWTVQSDQVPEVAGRPAVAALTHHRIQAAGRECGELLQRLQDDRQIGLDLRGAQYRPIPGQSDLGQDAMHGRVMNVQLLRNGAAAPFLDVIRRRICASNSG